MQRFLDPPGHRGARRHFLPENVGTAVAGRPVLGKMPGVRSGTLAFSYRGN
jgi:hypothetical protein